MKKLVSILLYLVYLGAAVLLVLYLVFWRPWVDQKRQTSVPENNELPTITHVQPETLQKAGTLITDKESSFIRFSYEKPAGTIRVCAIGDSFVHGEEVGGSLDYSTQLGKLFKDHGYSNVEVINYGNGWHGFHQAFTIWEDIAKPMGCDFVVTGPSGFFQDRDTQMNHTGDNEPYYLHSIYALNKQRNDVFRIDVHGTTYAERFDDYYRFIPRWQQLRYENLPPPVIRAILPPGKTIKNPFYYLNDQEDPTTETWDILLHKIARESTQVIVMHQHEPMASSGSRFQLGNYASLQLDDYNFFPNRAPCKHASGTANHRTAQILFNLLTNQPDKTYPTLVTKDLSTDKQTSATPISWDTISGIEVWTPKQKIGDFIYVDHRMHQPWALPANQNISLLNIRQTNLGLFDGVFLAVEFPIDSSLPLILTDRIGHTITLAAVKSRIPALSLYESKIDAFSFGYWDNMVLDVASIARSTDINLEGEITVSLGDHTLLQGTIGPNAQDVTLTPASGVSLVRAVAYGESRVDLSGSPETVYLRTRTASGETNYPVASTVNLAVEMPAIHGGIATIICRSGSQGVISPAQDCKKR